MGKERKRARERPRERERERKEEEERDRRSIIVINTITINASETAARSRESAWIPFMLLLSRPSFSGYITTSQEIRSSGNSSDFPRPFPLERHRTICAGFTRSTPSRFADVCRFCHWYRVLRPRVIADVCCYLPETMRTRLCPIPALFPRLFARSGCQLFTILALHRCSDQVLLRTFRSRTSNRKEQRTYQSALTFPRVSFKLSAIMHSRLFMS